jgi:hypothetical protein
MILFLFAPFLFFYCYFSYFIFYARRKAVSLEQLSVANKTLKSFQTTARTANVGDRASPTCSVLSLCSAVHESFGD